MWQPLDIIQVRREGPTTPPIRVVRHELTPIRRSTLFISFYFMFGPSSSQYFSGLLLIFVRRPFDIGDKIAISDPQSDTSPSGSSTWFVEKVTLYSTTVRFATTNEVATFSNGSLASLRIINAKRSPKAIVYVYIKFGSDVSFDLVNIFHTAVKNFIKARPREWAQLNGFRVTRVEIEQNFIEYVIGKQRQYQALPQAMIHGPKTLTA